ncbi:MAG: hypothetical protein ABI589_02625 [Burkholderiales bacterium]
MKIGRFVAACATLWFALCCAAPAAEVAGIQFNGSGFLTAAAGKVLGGTHDPETDLGWNCPCYISDFSRGGVYESGRVRVGPDSRLGLQGTASVADGRYSLTAQVVSRGAANGKGNLEWLYATANLTSTWTVQVGRKRLPLLAYSEVQDVGFAYPWINLPPQLYGWDTVNFNGVSVLHRDRYGDWFAGLNLFAGRETVRDSRYWKLYNGKHSRTDTRWSNIGGAELKLSRDWFEARVVHIRTDVQQRNFGPEAGEANAGGGGVGAFGDRYREYISGVSMSADWRNLIGRTEWLYINRTQERDVGASDSARMHAIGYRIGSFLPMLTYSRYKEKLVVPGGDEGHRTWSFLLRYDINPSSAVKIQYADWRDKSKPGYESPRGNARLLAVSYDRVF